MDLAPVAFAPSLATRPQGGKIRPIGLVVGLGFVTFGIYWLIALLGSSGQGGSGRELEHGMREQAEGDSPGNHRVADFDHLALAAEVDGGDPTISIICSAVAVEAALTQVFVKWKKIEHNVVMPTGTQRDEWEKEYRNAARRDKSRRSGFEKSADLVSKSLTNKMFDDFVSGYVKKSGVIVLNFSGPQKTVRQA